MVKEDVEFRKNVSQFLQIGYCSSFVHRRWNIANKRKKRKLEIQKLKKQKADDYQALQTPINIDQGTSSSCVQTL